MAAILADDIFEWIFVKVIPESPTDSKKALVQVMAWRQPGDKPLPEPMVTQFTDAYVRHSASMG